MTESFFNLKDLLKNVKLPRVNSAFGQIITDWDFIVGKKFAGKTEIADFVQHGTKLYLYVNVASSPLVQELTFFKFNLIKKIKATYKVEIDDIIVKVASKNKNKQPDVKQNLVEEVYSIRPKIEELEKIELPKDDIEKIIASVNTQKNLDEQNRERIIKLIINDLKTQEWMKQKGFPVCKKCGCVMTKKIFGDDDICRFCKNEEQYSNISKAQDI